MSGNRKHIMLMSTDDCLNAKKIYKISIDWLNTLWYNISPIFIMSVFLLEIKTQRHDMRCEAYERVHIYSIVF